MKHHALLLLVFVAACGSKKSSKEQAPPPVASADGGGGGGAIAIDPALAAELQTLGDKKRAELEAMVVEPPDDPTPPDEPPDEDTLPPNIAAAGACTRPDAAKRAELSKQVKAWIARTVPRGKPVEDGSSSMSFGCLEPAGIVIDAQADLAVGDSNDGYFWTLRVGPKGVQVIADAKGCALIECMEWSQARSVTTMVLADLDGDGTSDPVMARDDHEVGGPTDYEVLVPGAAGKPVVVGHVTGDVSVVPVAAPPAGTVVVAAHTMTSDGESEQYRCVTKTAPWTSCPVAQRLDTRDEALEAADQLPELLADHDELEHALALLEVPAAERTRFLAAAAPSPLSTVVERYRAGLTAAVAARTPDEQSVLDAQAANQLADELRAALGQARCTPTDAQRKAAAAQLKRWLAGSEKGSAAVAVNDGCVGPSAALWLVEWTVPASPGAGAGDDPEVPPHDKVQKTAVIFVKGAEIKKVVEGATPIADQGPEGPAPYEYDQLPSAKLFVQGGSVGALVFGPGEKTSAVIDGAVTGSRDGELSKTWQAESASGELEISSDTVARTEDGGTVTYWQAGPKGVVPATNPRLDAVEQQRQAWQLLADVTDWTKRDPIVAALKATGAPPAVIDKASKAAAR